MVGLLACGSADPGSGGTGGGGATGGNGATGGSGGIGGSPSERRIFVTSTAQTANLGGLDGADQLCATQAADAGLEGDFRAWLSTVSLSVAEHLSLSGGPFVLVDGTIVANDWDDLVDGALLAPINLDAMGQARTGDVWTGTLPTGESYLSDDCTTFTSESSTVGQALCGSSTSITTTWTQSQTPRCSTLLRLYCIEQ
jgi:hypothetical protein